MYILKLLSGMHFTLYLTTFVAIVLFWSVCCCVYYMLSCVKKGYQKHVILCLHC